MVGHDSDVIVVDLRTREGSGSLAIGTGTPRLSWRLAASRDRVVQRGYELQVGSDEAFTAPLSSGRIETNLPFDAAWPAAPLRSREVCWIRVRVWTDAGCTAWSEPLRLEAALLAAKDWIARPVSTPGNVGRRESVPMPLLRRSFDLPAEVRQARLYVTALGVHATTINGKAVSSDLLEPGWSAYPRRHLYAAHDVTQLLRKGENVIASAVGDGWWRGELTWLGKRAFYGDTTAVLAQLEVVLVDGTRLTIASDETWRGATGGWLAADLYAGATLDLRAEPWGWRDPGFDDGRWEETVVLPTPERLTLRPMAGVRVVETREITGERSSRGTILFDCGQNLTGWLRLEASGPSGSKIEVRHAEVLDDHGRLHTAPLRNARATDGYTLDGSGTVTLEPLHTFHGFRFAEIEVDEEVDISRAEVRVVTSDVHPTGTFDCSEPRLNKLWRNVCWSQRGNFLALPTDCPQRDERMGWTGDIQVFGRTASMNSDVQAFLISWLADLAADQRDDGAVPAVVPNCIPESPLAFGSAGWGDAATLTPWALYEAYGDVQVLRDQFVSMCAWVDYCASRLNEDGVWEGDWQFGDWLDPGAPSGRPDLATTPAGYIASAYLAHSAATLSKSAGLVGQEEYVKGYATLSEAVASATWAKWRSDAFRTQTGCAIAIMLGIAPKEEWPALGATLASLVHANQGRIATGFLGTPLVLPALTATGQLDAAYQLLLNRSAPGWLFQVDRGATTMWERWDAIREDGSIHPGAMDDGSSMMSFNHYAYGAVAEWLYRDLAGIAPDQAGYARIRFAPHPGAGLTHAEASLLTPFGTASIAWRLEGERLLVDLVVPAGATAFFIAPDQWSDHKPEQSHLPSGRHRIVLAPEDSATMEPRKTRT